MYFDEDVKNGAADNDADAARVAELEEAIAGLTAERDAAVADLATVAAARDAAAAAEADLETKLAAAEAAATDAAAAAEADLEAANSRVAILETQLAAASSDADATVAELKAQLATANASIESLEAAAAAAPPSLDVGDVDQEGIALDAESRAKLVKAVRFAESTIAELRIQYAKALLEQQSVFDADKAELEAKLAAAQSS